MPNTPVLGLPYPAPADPADVPADMQALALKLDGTAGIVPVGCMMMWPLQAPPVLWLICNGAAIPAEYEELIALLGPNTPDMREKVPYGALTADAVRQAGGAKEVALTTPGQLPAHNHAINNSGIVSNASGAADRNLDHQHVGAAGLLYVLANGGVTWELRGSQGGPNIFGPLVVSGANSVTVSSVGGQMDRSIDHTHAVSLPTHSHGMQNTGNSEPHPNLPPYLTVNYIIRAG